MPSPVRHRYIIAYDIADDPKRSKLSSILQDYGDRVQKSVFEADLTADDLQDIMLKASGCVDKEDSLRIYPTCATCRKGLRIIGRSSPSPAQTLIMV